MENNPILEVTIAKVDELVPYAGNAKEHPEVQVDQIARSIEEFGMCDPVGVWHDADGTPVIVEGHGRVLALKKLGIEEVPIIALDHLTDEERRAYAHVHNQTTLTSGFNLDKLAADINDLPVFDWEAFGFELPEPPLDMSPEADEVPDDAPTIVERGQVWRLGDHRLMCGDSTDVDDVVSLMGGGDG